MSSNRLDIRVHGRHIMELAASVLYNIDTYKIHEDQTFDMYN